MESTPEPEPVEGDNLPLKPIRKIWFFMGLLVITLLAGLTIWGAGNEPPQIIYLSPMYGSIGPAGTNEVIVFTEDDTDLPNELRYEWEVSEGLFELTEKPYAITYRAPIAPGSYYVFVTVTVTDSWGARSTATTRILITDRGY